MPRRKTKDADGLFQRPDSPYWWASFTDARGRRARRSTGKADRAEAEVVLAGWRLDASRGQGADPEHGPTFDGLMLLYLQGPSTEKRSAERDRWSARRLTEYFSGRELRSLGAADLTAYIGDRKAAGVGAGTINREIGLLSSALNWARRDLEWDVPNPASGRRLKEPEGRVRWLRRDEAERLIRAAEAEPKAEHLADFIRLGLHTGMRRNEMLGLEWSRVDLGNGLIRLDSQHTKGARRRGIPLNAVARSALVSRQRWRDEHAPGSAWVFCREDRDEQGVVHWRQIKSVRHSFASACRRAGIEDFTPHDLRHTCAAWLVSAGVPLPEVRDLLGHSTIAMTERYAHLAPERVRAAVEVLDLAEEPRQGYGSLGLPESGWLFPETIRHELLRFADLASAHSSHAATPTEAGRRVPKQSKSSYRGCGWRQSVVDP